MKKSTFRYPVFGLLAVVVTLFLTACAKDVSSESSFRYASSIDPVKAEKINQMISVIDTNIDLENFDPSKHLSFTPQEWISSNENLTEGVRVMWPDGKFTDGHNDHAEKLKEMFTYAPDTKLTMHPMRFASPEKTATAGMLRGTFTEPLNIGEGKTVRPTGKTFSIPFYTIGFWENGKMVEKYFFWDEESYRSQLGLS